LGLIVRMSWAVSFSVKRIRLVLPACTPIKLLPALHHFRFYFPEDTHPLLFWKIFSGNVVGV